MLRCVVEEEEPVAYKHVQCIAHSHIVSELGVFAVVEAIVERSLVGSIVYHRTQVDGVVLDLVTQHIRLSAPQFGLMQVVQVAFAFNLFDSDIGIRFLEDRNTCDVTVLHVVHRHLYRSI